MRRVCKGTRVHMSKQSQSEWPGKGGGCGECVRVHYEHTVRQRVARQRRRIWRACTGTLLAHIQATSGQAGEEDAASVYGYTKTQRTIAVRGEAGAPWHQAWILDINSVHLDTLSRPCLQVGGLAGLRAGFHQGLVVGPSTWCSSRHIMSFDSRNNGLEGERRFRVCKEAPGFGPDPRDGIERTWRLR